MFVQWGKDCDSNIFECEIAVLNLLLLIWKLTPSNCYIQQKVSWISSGKPTTFQDSWSFTRLRV